MAKCDFTDSAKRDIEDIADYSLKHWGKQQTIKYLEEIYRKTLDLSINPNIGVLRSDIYPNLLSFPIRKQLDLLHNVANKEEFEGDTERRTAAYT